MIITSLTADQSSEVERIVTESWGGLHIAAHRKLYDLRELPCLIAITDKHELLGYCYYRISGGECEIMAIESIIHNIGVGSTLIDSIKKLAAESNCSRVYLQTTNDNTHAFRFYQRRGFTISAFRLNELDYARTLKPSIPQLGEDGIPIQHEIEFEYMCRE